MMVGVTSIYDKPSSKLDNFCFKLHRLKICIDLRPDIQLGCHPNDGDAHTFQYGGLK